MFAHSLSGAAMTAADRLCRMARSLARPVCRDLLRYSHADAALITAALRAERAGELGTCTAGEMVRFLRLTLRTWIEREQQRRDLAAYHIKREIKPKIALHRPSGELLAEAHDANAADGRPLTEDEVTDVVEVEVWFALPPAPRTPRRRWS